MSSPLGFTPVSEAQYRAMVRDGAGGKASPFDPLYAEMMAAGQGEDVDVRLLLAFTRAENNNATNISSGLLAAHNGGGIKYVRQRLALPLLPDEAGVWRTADGRPAPLAPANEGSVPYCVFPSWEAFLRTLARNIATILPDDFAAGNLLRIVRYYTSGYPDRPGGGDNKATFYAAYVRDYPPQRGGDMATKAVTGADVLTEATKWLGTTDRGRYDASNGGGTPFLWCQAFAEAMHERAGVRRTRYATALAFLNDPDCPTHPLPAPAGACILFGRGTDPAGHVAISDGAGGMIGTVRTSDTRNADGTYPGTIRRDPVWAGSAGWQWYPGVTATAVAAPPVTAQPTGYVQGGNPYGEIALHPAFVPRWKALEAVNLAYPHIGYATEPPVTLPTGRITQRCERCVLAVGEGDGDWSIVALLLTEVPPSNVAVGTAPR